MNVTQHHPKVKVTLAIPNSVFVSGDEIRGKFMIESRTENALGLATISVELLATQGELGIPIPSGSGLDGSDWHLKPSEYYRAHVQGSCRDLYLLTYASGLPRRRPPYFERRPVRIPCTLDRAPPTLSPRAQRPNVVLLRLPPTCDLAFLYQLWKRTRQGQI